MGAKVPLDDLPGSLVPADDLPSEAATLQPVPSHGTEAAPVAEESNWDKAKRYVTQFFDPQNPKHGDPNMGFGEAMTRQALKAGSLITANPVASGAMFAAGTTEATTPVGAVVDTAKGAIGGKIAGAVVPRVIEGAGALRALSRGGPRLDPTPLLRPPEAATLVPPAGEAAVSKLVQAVTGGSVKPGPSAQLLSSHGVRTTRAQTDPGSAVNKLEQALENTHPYGAEITAQRGQFRSDLQIAALNVARPPGVAPIPMGTPFDEGMAALDAGFQRAYERVGSVPVYPAVQGPGGGPLLGMGEQPGLIERAVDGVKRLAGSRRQQIKDDIVDLLSTLPERKGAVGRVAADDLLAVRSVLRKRARAAGSEGGIEGEAAEEAYRAAAQRITDAIEPQLPAGLAEHLRATDAAYRNFAAVDNTARAARTRVDGFTGIDLAREASKGLRGTEIQAGKAGPLYELGMAAADVGRTVAPRTGASAVTLQTAVEGLDLLPVVGPKLRNWVNAKAIIEGNRAAMSPLGPAREPLLLPGVGAAGAGSVPVSLDAFRELLARRALRLGSAAGDEDPASRSTPR